MTKKSSIPKQLLKCLILVDSALEIVEDSPEMSQDKINSKMEEVVKRQVPLYTPGLYCSRKYQQLLQEGHELLRDMSDDDKATIMTFRVGSSNDGATYWNKWKKIRSEIMNIALPAWAKVMRGSISGIITASIML